MQPMIAPVDRELLEQELDSGLFVRNTNNGSNRIYIADQNNAPNVLLEIGRLRELTFRHAGGGTGLDCDLDEYDIRGSVYKQIGRAHV